MIKLQLHRIAHKENYTIGRLYVNGDYFCDTLEDKVRDLPKTCPRTAGGKECDCKQKVYAQTAIPEGRYNVCVTYSPRFKRNLPRLLDVPHFQGILIHRGNSQSDSAGCILVGENKAVGRLINSSGYEERLLAMLKPEKEITLEISRAHE